jgi:cbb3-type cytochrome oxidase maturation protein
LNSVVEILILLIPMSVVIALVIGAVFWWSAESGQFDDLDNPGQRILLDDDKPAAMETAPVTESPKAAENKADD